MDKKSQTEGNHSYKDVKGKPIIAITMGDPTGVGPEVICKALGRYSIKKRCRLFVIGDRAVMEWAASRFSPHLCIKPINGPDEISDDNHYIYLLSLTDFSAEEIVYGMPSRQMGAGMFLYIKKAAELAMQGKIDAVVTAPINKRVITESGIFTDDEKGIFTGHTEFFMNYAGCRQVAMMLAGRRLKVVPVTTHIPLRQVSNTLTKEKILNCIELTYQGMKIFFGKKMPKIAVSALNPHAGEGGVFGDEEKDIIIPAVEEAREKGIDVSGPYPPDTVYFQALRGIFDVIIGMYHDQALIPLKLIDFFDAVNITLGLPFIRTSVDHGTAYDIAGKGVANERSMINAIKLAAHAARRINHVKGRH